MRYQGRIANWNDGKGFGFVTPNGGGEKAFVHIKSFPNSRRRPVEGDLVTYDAVSDPRRGLRAEKIRYVDLPRTAHAPSGATPWGVIFAVSFGLTVAVLALLGKLPLLIPLVYLGMSAFTFIVYAFDKSAALNNRWRTKESTLHLLGVAGGWPGALVAQRLLRHKSRKEEFQSVFWLTVFLNGAALAWTFTAGGRLFLDKIAGGL